MSRLCAEEGKVDFSLYLISDRKSLPSGQELVATVRAALRGGVRAVQLREKDLSAAELYPLALALRQVTREFSARLLINDRVDLALAVDADGVHLGAHSLPVSVVRQLLGEQRIIGVSTHHPDEVHRAAVAGADFVTFGPVYSTPSKIAYGPPVGLEPLAAVCADPPLPVFALGGVSVARLPELRAAGCAHVALIGAILQAVDPEEAARGLLRGITG
ncbi:MAG: thiamine phosphate synthase [Deltaproteobacteria bacterium HGW-Deltaproteobacteria-4]|nr:MAG: thiamine phosphate synthase [Deltaproteobacteria bacterium HGW-Deltaproteobacteria-4]